MGRSMGSNDEDDRILRGCQWAWIQAAMRRMLWRIDVLIASFRASAAIIDPLSV